MKTIEVGLFVLDQRLISLYEWEIKKHEEMKVVFRADDFENFRTRLAESNSPDIIIVFLPCWGEDVIDFTFFNKITLGIKKLLVIGKHEECVVLEAIKLGFHGYLITTDTRQTFTYAITEVVKYGGYLSRKIITDFFAALQYTKQEKVQEKLSVRENEIAELLCEGLTYQQIAEKRFITTFAVNQHLKKIYKKLGIHSKGELIAMMLK
jgi:DNA-binding NarL/FixJ family response regulator